MIYSDRHRIRIGAESLTNFAVRWDEPWSMESLVSVPCCLTKPTSEIKMVSNIATGAKRSGSTLFEAVTFAFDETIKENNASLFASERFELVFVEMVRCKCDAVRCVARNVTGLYLLIYLRVSAVCISCFYTPFATGSTLFT
jgi:hypothetical protein